MKIYMRITYGDSGRHVEFGTSQDVHDWKAEQKVDEEQGHYCGEDKIICIGEADTPQKTIELINKHIWEEETNDE